MRHIPLSSEIPNALPVQYILGHYQITAILADDEFSITYKATHTLLNLPVIIKEYLPKSIVLRNKSMTNVILKDIENAQLYESALTQYRQETNQLLTLHHPNIANVRECIDANNTTYRITGFIENHTVEKNTPPHQKNLEIDFSILKSQTLSSIKKNEKQQYTIVIAMTMVMLGLLIVGVASYEQPIKKRMNIENSYKIKDSKKASFITSLQPKIIPNHLNLTLISTIIENFYFHSPEKKLFSFKIDKKSRNNKTQTLSSALKKNNALKKAANENIIENIPQTGRSNIIKYKITH